MRFSMREDAKSVVVLPTSCRACRHADVATVTARGSGHYRVSWMSIASSVRKHRTGEARAEGEIDARYNGLLMSRVARCPKCQQRDVRWAAWVVLLGSLWGVVAAAIPFAIGSVAHTGPWWIGGFAWAVLPFAGVTAWKARRDMTAADDETSFASSRG